MTPLKTECIQSYAYSYATVIDLHYNIFRSGKRMGVVWDSMVRITCSCSSSGSMWPLCASSTMCVLLNVVEGLGKL